MEKKTDHFADTSKKAKKRKYSCDTCANEFYVTVTPNVCPICGSKTIHAGSKESQTTAREYINKLNEMIPKLEKLADDFVDLYVEYKTVQETARVYANRGIIGKEEVPKFKMPNLTEAFHESRKKKGVR